MREMMLAVCFCAAVIAGHAQSPQPSSPAKRGQEISLGEFYKLDRAASAKVFGERFDAVADSIMTRLESPTDAKGQPKTPELLAAERKRAALVREVFLNYDISEMAIRLQLALDANPKIELGRVLTRYLLDEVLKREEEARKKK